MLSKNLIAICAQLSRKKCSFNFDRNPLKALAPLDVEWCLMLNEFFLDPVLLEGRECSER